MQLCGLWKYLFDGLFICDVSIKYFPKREVFHTMLAILSTTSSNVKIIDTCIVKKVDPGVECSIYGNCIIMYKSPTIDAM